jgi:hypothetical protein
VVALVEQSLVRQMPGSADEPRYRMLETVREFGLERLIESGEEEDARRRHAEHFLRLAADLVPGSAVLMDQASLNRVVAEHDNVRLALAWCDAHDETDGLLQLSFLLYGLWVGHGLYREGVQWVERGLERSPRVPSAALVRALDLAGTLAIFQGDYARTASCFDEGVTLARALGDRLVMAEALTYVAFLAYRRRAFARAEELLDEARRTLGGHAATAPGALPFVTLGGVVPLFHIGDLALVQGLFARATMEYEAGIALFRAAGSESGWRDMQAGLAAVRYLTGDIPGAAALYAESLQHAHAMAFWPLVVSALVGLAGIAADTGQPEVGARLLGAAAGIATSMGSPMYTRDHPVHDRVLATVQLALGAEQLAALQDIGRTLSTKEAIVEAHAIAQAVASASLSHGACALLRYWLRERKTFGVRRGLMKPVPYARVIGTTCLKAAWNRWPRNAALYLGRDYSRRITRREAQHERRVYLFR